MYSRSARPQWPSASTCSAQPIGSGPTVWIEKPRANPRVCVGLVELLGGDLRRRRLVLAQQVGEAPGDLRRALDHDVAPDLVVRVGEPVRPARAGGVQQQPRRLDRVAGDGDRGGALEALASVAHVGHAGAAAGLVDLDAHRVAVGADLDAVGDRVGQVGDQRRGLGVDLAALQAEAAVDAVRAVAEDAVGDRHRPDAHLDSRCAGAGAGAIGAAGDGCAACG